MNLITQEKIIDLPGGVKHDYFQLLKRINRYKFNEYLNSGGDPRRTIKMHNVDSDVFLSISRGRRDLVATNLDSDTKDFTPVGVGEVNEYQNFLLRVKFRDWAANNGLAITLNDIATNLADYGTVVIKRVGDKLEVVDLETLYIEDVGVEHLIDTAVANIVPVKRHEVLKKGWDNEEKILGMVNEETGEVDMVDQWSYNEEGTEYIHQIYVHEGDSEDVEKIVAFEKVIPVDKKTGRPKEFPYYDFHINAYEGRFLRQGTIELLFEPQEMYNELVNRNRENQRIASLILFRTAEEETYGNLLSGVESGEIINTSDLQQIAVDNRAFNEFIATAQYIENYADRLLGTFGVIAGETPPSGTTFRGQAASINRARQRFDFNKQYVWESFGQLIKKEILPNEIKKWNKGGIVNTFYTDQDISFYDKMIIDAKRAEFLMKAEEAGRAVTNQELLELDQKTQQEIDTKGRKLNISADQFNMEFGFRITPTNESVDKSQRNDSMFNAIQLVLSNPAITDIPLFRQMLEENNISPFRLTPEQVEVLKQTQIGPVPQAKEGDKLSELINQ